MIGSGAALPKTSVTTTVVTLTYGGGDTPESRFLRKSDITTYLKTIRNAGHKVRYFAVGEVQLEEGPCALAYRPVLAIADAESRFGRIFRTSCGHTGGRFGTAPMARLFGM